MNFVFSVDYSGYGGGLTLLWNSDVNINLLSYNMRHIWHYYVARENLTWWSIYRILWPPWTIGKETFLVLIGKGCPRYQQPLDYVEGISTRFWRLRRKEEVAQKNINLIFDFKNALEDCGLYGLGWEGYPFTCSNTETLIANLDRFNNINYWTWGAFN